MTEKKQQGFMAAETAAWQAYVGAHYKSMQAQEKWRAAYDAMMDWIDDVDAPTSPPGARNPFDDEPVPTPSKGEDAP